MIQPFKLRLRDVLTFDLQASRYFEYFFVFAVSTVVVTRVYLAATGYPQIGGGPLHIAHLLWGGLLLLVAFSLLLAFQNPERKIWSATIAGVGFGLFIDEIGKFVTTDNDYFFEPAIAMIYVAFVLLYLAGKFFFGRIKHTDETYMVNVIDLFKEYIRGDLSQAEKELALSYLTKVEHHSQFSKQLHRLLTAEKGVPDTFSVYGSVKSRAKMVIGKLSSHSLLVRVLLLVFVFNSIWHFFIAVLVIASTWGESMPFSLIGYVFSISIVGVLVAVACIQYFARRRDSALSALRYANLVSLLLVQPFLFYQDQLLAGIQAMYVLLLFILLRNIQRE